MTNNRIVTPAKTNYEQAPATARRLRSVWAKNEGESNGNKSHSLAQSLQNLSQKLKHLPRNITFDRSEENNKEEN